MVIAPDKYAAGSQRVYMGGKNKAFITTFLNVSAAILIMGQHFFDYS